MAGYTFDSLRGTLRLVDTPVSYQPPMGPGIAFTTTYNQADLGALVTPLFGNLGPQWTYNWLSYINGNPQANPGGVNRFVPGGGLEYYPSFQPSSGYRVGNSGNSYQFYGTFAPERNSRAVLSWDPEHQRYTRTLPDGSAEVYDHVVTDSAGAHYLMTSMSDPQGLTVTLAYDTQNRLTTITDAVGQVTTLSYGLASDPMKITQVTDPFGRSATFTYDAQGRFHSSTDPLQIVSSYTYSGTGTFISALTTPYGTTTFTNETDSAHQAVNATNPLGQTERIELRYGSTAIPDSETSVPTATGLLIRNSGLSSANSYHWTRREYADGAGDYTKADVIHWMVGERGLTDVPASTKRPLEGRVWYTYSGQTYAGLLSDDASSEAIVTARLLDSGATQAYYATYTPYGNIASSTDSVGRTTNYSYASNEMDLTQVAQTNGTGQDILSAMTYNSQHEPLTITDASGRVTTMTYNTAGQLLTRTNAKGETTTLTYNSGGYLSTVTGPVAGSTTTYSYDSVGRVHTVTDSEGYVLTTTYDNLDRPIRTTYPDSTYDQTLYDDPTRPLDVAHTIDRQGRVTANQYDPIHELLQTTDPLGRTTKYTWCTCGGLSTLTDANGNVTTWGLDMEGRVTSKTYADSTAINYVYETNLGRLHSMTDARGDVAVYSYNADNTLAATTYTVASGVASTPNVSFAYDSVYNRVIGMTDGTGTTSYSYNAIPSNAATSPTTGAGRLASVSVPIAGSSATVTYGYDELGRVTSRGVDASTTDANNVNTTFDSLGRVTGVTNALGAFTYAYVDQTSRLSGIIYPSGTGLSTAYSYFGNTGDQRLETIQNLHSTTQLSRFDYTYNPVGTIATWTQQADSSTAVVNTLTYDGADQLTSAVQSGGGSASNAYNYDPAGNRLAEITASTTTAGQFNSVNQLTGLGSTTSQTVSGNTSSAVNNVTVNAVPASISNQTNFTANVPLPGGTNTVSVVASPTSGSVTTKRYQIVTSGAPTALTYDTDGNTLTDENGNSYQWDALNRLAKITYPSGAVSLFAYDGLSRRTQILEENSSGSVTSTKNYLWIGSEIIEERDASNNVTKRFFPQGEQQSGTDYYYTRDHLGSVRELCSSTGTITSRMTYDPYGVTTIVSGTVLPTKQYAGYYMHQGSALYLTKYREFDSNTGRWLSRDPIGSKGGVDLYGYVLNNPGDWNDSLGLRPQHKVGPPTAVVAPGESSPWSQSVYINTMDCKCTNMKFIQTVDNGYGPSVDNAFNPDPTSPYYDNQGSSQSMSDRPGPHDPDTNDPSNWFTRLFFSWWHFETCAVCLDSGQPQIIGCVTWTIYYDSSGRAHMTGMTGPSGTALEPPSPGFNNTLNDFKNSDYYSQPGEH